MPDGPYLALVAFWQDDPDTDKIAEAVREQDFPSTEGFPRGKVVAFRYEVANSVGFRRDLRRLDLAELNERPSSTTSAERSPGSAVRDA